MPKQYGRRAAAPYKKCTSASKGSSQRTAPAFRKKVLAVVKRIQETKNAVLPNAVTITVWDPATQVLTQDDMTQSVFSAIQQGVSDGQRIGNKISIRSWTIKGSIVSTLPTNAPFYIKMIILKLRNPQNGGLSPYSNLFEATNPSQPINTLHDIYSPLNKDSYVFYAARVFKLGSSTNAANPNNDFSVSKMFSIDMTKHVKQVIWDQGQAPTNLSDLSIIFLGCYADNTAITFGPYTGPTVDIDYTSYVRYTDD